MRLSGNGDFRSFEPERCCWQSSAYAIRHLVPWLRFSQATLIEENQPSHLATLHGRGTHRSRTETPAEKISLAYKASNIRASTARPLPHLEVKRRLEYVRWARDVVAGLRGANPSLEAEFDKAAVAAEESVSP